MKKQATEPTLKKVSVNIQGQKSSKNLTLIMAYVNAGFIDDHEPERTGKNTFVFRSSISHIKAIKGKSKTYKPVYLSSGISLPSAFWDNKSKKATGAYADLNKEIEAFKKTVEILIEDNKLRIHSADDLKELLTEFIKQKKGKTVEYSSTPYAVPTSLVEYVKWKMNYFLKHGLREENSMKNYQKLVNILTAYGKTLDLLTLTNHQIDELMLFIKDQKTKDGNYYSHGYLSMFKKDIKSFITKAKNEDDIEVHPKLNLKRESLKKKREVDDTAPLTLKEFERIMAVEVDKDEPMLLKAKEMVLVGAFCGLRLDDLCGLEHLKKKDGKHFFDVLTDKTEAKVEIPVMDERIIKLYKKNNSFKFDMHKNTFNECFKILGLRAKLNQTCYHQFIDPKTNKPKKDSYQYYQKLSGKVLRKTFASIMIRDFDMPISVVMAWTGHKTEQEFRVYAQITPTEYYEIANRQLAKMLQIKKAV